MSRAEMRLARSTGSGDYRGASARQPLLAPDPDPEPPFSRGYRSASGYRGPRRGRSPRHPDTMTSLFTRQLSDELTEFSYHAEVMMIK